MEKSLLHIKSIERSTQMGSQKIWSQSQNITTLPTLSPLAQNISIEDSCLEEKKEVYSSFFSVTLAIPEWEALVTSIMLSIIIVLTIVGNILVILSVFTYKPLRIAQNFFIVSLAVADLAVALLVLPLNVAYSILGRWEFGIHMCKLWLTSDVMCCTSSILNLCAIALDRFWAITDPINYAHKRTMTRVLVLISGVWILSFLISSPPLFGWNDWPSQFTSTTPCELTSNRGYVIYSALGSFYIPLVIMTVVYLEIYIATKRRLRERRLASHMQKLALNKTNASLSKFEVSVHENEDTSFSCLRFFCCRKSSRLSMTATVQDEKESCSSDTQMNSDIQRESVKKKTFETKVQPNTLVAEKRDSINALETCTSWVQGNDNGATQNLEPQSDFNSPSELSYNRKDDNGSKPLKEKGKSIVEATEKQAQSQSQPQPMPTPTATATLTLNINVEKECTRVYQFVEEKQKISLSKERRAARTLGIIMGVFVICWLPFFLMYVILPFCKTCCPTQKLKNFITWLGYINSSLNPLIYTIFNLDYRRAFKRLLGLK